MLEFNTGQFESSKECIKKGPDLSFLLKKVTKFQLKNVLFNLIFKNVYFFEKHLSCYLYKLAYHFTERTVHTLTMTEASSILSHAHNIFIVIYPLPALNSLQLVGEVFVYYKALKFS